MIVTQDIARIAQALLKDTTGSLVEATWQSLTPLNLTPGQMVHGEVMANLANSRYLVRIANELLRMELPLNLQPGQAVELTYVTDEPRLLFALSKSGNSATPVQISDTGRWLNTLSQGTGDTPAAAPLPRPSLVIPGPPRDPALLAEGLKNVLTRSGVFYESHLAQWIQGERPLADLLREPQGQLSPLAGRLPAEGNGAHPTPHGTQTAPTPQTAPAPQATPPAATPPARATSTPPPEEAGIPSVPRPLSTLGGPQQQGAAPPTRDPGTPAGEILSGSDAATVAPKGGQAPASESREPLPQPAPRNQPPSPGRPGEAPAPLPAQHQQTGTAPPPPHSPAGEAPTALPQTTAAAAGSPQPRPSGEVSAQQPATVTTPGDQAPQVRNAVVPGPPEGNRPATDPRPPTESPLHSPLRDGAPTAPAGRNAAPPPLPGPPEGSPRAPIPGEAAPAGRGPAAPPPPGIEPQTIPLIKEQLATLTTGVFTWFGQVWPGQDMEWKVEEREAEGGKRERSWQTEVAVELPGLGAVRATLRSGGEGIAVMLMAEDGRTAEILAAGQNGLEERFGAAGLRLGGFTVRDGTQ